MTGQLSVALDVISRKPLLTSTQAAVTSRSAQMLQQVHSTCNMHSTGNTVLEIEGAAIAGYPVCLPRQRWPCTLTAA